MATKQWWGIGKRWWRGWITVSERSRRSHHWYKWNTEHDGSERLETNGERKGKAVELGEGRASLTLARSKQADTRHQNRTKEKDSERKSNIKKGCSKSQTRYQSQVIEKHMERLSTKTKQRLQGLVPQKQPIDCKESERTPRHTGRYWQV